MNGVVNKKVLIILSLIIILLIIPAIFFGLKSSHSTQLTQNNAITTENANSNAAPTNSLVTFHNASYTLSYPNNWSKNEKELSNNEGTVVIFQPQTVNSGHYATINVEVVNAQDTSIGTLTHLFDILHYTKTNTTVAGITAMKYTAVLPTQKGDLHSIAYIFQQNEKIYTLKLEYIQSNINEQLEGQFYQLLNSFSIQ